MDAPASKADVRRSLRQQRRERQAAEDEARRIAEHVLDLEEVRSACNEGAAIACYVARPDEPPTHELINSLRSAGATVRLPRVEGDNLAWVETNTDTAFASNVWNIDEPIGDPTDEPPALWIIPALAVDADGFRLGQGGGYYDRTLADLPDDGRGPIIALVFEHEALPAVPREDHDRRVDVVVTPERVRWLSMPD